MVFPESCHGPCLELFCFIFIGCSLIYIYKEIGRRCDAEVKKELKRRRKNVRYTKNEIDMMRKNYEKTIKEIKKNARSDIQSTRHGVPKTCSFCKKYFSSGNRLHNHLDDEHRLELQGTLQKRFRESSLTALVQKV